MPPPTLRHGPAGRRSEGLGQRRPGATRQALDEQVGGPATRADVVDPQDGVGADGGALVGEPHPREVVEVPVGAAGDEPGRHRRRRPTGPIAVGVRVTGAIDPVGVVVELQSAGSDGEQPIAGGAPEPAGEDGDRQADARPVVVWVVGGLRLDRQRSQHFHLVTESSPDGAEQAVLGDDVLAGSVPAVEAADDDAEARQVDHGADAVGMDGLAGADRADPLGPVVGVRRAHRTAWSSTTSASSASASSALSASSPCRSASSSAWGGAASG